MAILYLTEQQAWVGREGECLVVHLHEDTENSQGTKKRERKQTIPLLKVEEVIILGDITVTTPALASLLEAKVPVTYFNRFGHYLGSLLPMLTKNSILRLSQHATYLDLQARHTLAQKFVVGKLKNMRTILMRNNRAVPHPAISAQIESLKRCIHSAEQTISIHGDEYMVHEIDRLSEEEENQMLPDRMHGLGSLLGCEGAGSAAYFGSFVHLIKCEWAHGFSKRSRRPPTDPVNAMLSYGYVILTAQVTSILAGVGFDPYIGYLHASRYGKPALALDLMEEFRPLIVDSVVLSLLNNRQLDGKDFIKELNSYRFTDPAKRVFLQKFEERMQENITHPVFGYNVSYRRCIELQARLLGKFLVGEVEKYRPFTVR